MWHKRVPGVLPSIFLIIFLIHRTNSSIETWEKDFTSEIEIGLSTTGYRGVDLKCGADGFLVNVTLDSDFEGVLYTRGDFSSKRKPCFYTSADFTNLGADTALFSMSIPFVDCHTVEDVSDQQYVNILVIQHDPELIIPGDAAFRLNCAFDPEIRLGSSITAGPKSRIVLVDADPASKKFSKEHQAQSDSDMVSLPKKYDAVKDEL